MPGFFYNLGRSVRAGVQKGKWVLQSLTGSDEEAIKAEYEAGVEVARAFEKDAPLDDDENVSALIDEIAAALVARAKNKLRKFTFRAVLLPEPNAFALPGGFIYITRGLIELCGGLGRGGGPTPLPLREGQGEGKAHHEPSVNDRAAHQRDDESERLLSPDSSTLPQPLPKREGSFNPSIRDELAFILGHEMGHVVRGHAMQRMVNSTVVNAAARAVPIGGAVGKLLVQTGSQFLSSAYSQDHELEADEFGLRLSRAAGFEPAAATQMMRRLQELGGDHPEDSLGAYFASHPPFTVRIRQLKELARA